MQFGLNIDGDLRAAVRFEEFPERARAALRRKIDELAGELLGQVIADEPQKTGQLRGETKKSIADRPEFVRGTVRVAAKDAAEARKAAALEYGAQKPAQVPAHAMRLTHVFGRQVAPFEVMVGAYSRPMHLAARRYLRSPLEAMRGEIRDGLQEALQEALA